METQQQIDPALFIKIAVSNWELQNTRLNALLDKLTDEQIAGFTALDRNSGTYLLGHLTAVSDGLFTLLELGYRLYPHLDEIFLKNADTSGLEKPAITDIKAAWHHVNATLKQKFDTMQPQDWFTKHSAISTEALKKNHIAIN